MLDAVVVVAKGLLNLSWAQKGSQRGPYLQPGAEEAGRTWRLAVVVLTAARVGQIVP